MLASSPLRPHRRRISQLWASLTQDDNTGDLIDARFPGAV
jgi:hypothetical protein